MKTYTNLSKTVFFLCSLFYFLNTQAQAPNKMSYQAVIRNASNVLVSNTNVRIKISILQSTATGTVVYSETHTPTTNTNGLATLEIGGGTIIAGNFATINWANGPFFIKTETDPTGGTNYTISGTNQLLSVPFAMYAASSGTSASNWTTTGTNIANNNTGNVGIGTGATVPSSLLTVKISGKGFTQEDATGTNKIGFFTNAANAYIQTHSNTDLSFTTNDGLSQMTLQKGTGNFGINTIYPTEKLEVNGKTKTSDLQVENGGGTGKVLTSDPYGNATWKEPELKTYGTYQPSFLSNIRNANVDSGINYTIPETGEYLMIVNLGVDVPERSDYPANGEDYDTKYSITKYDSNGTALLLIDTGVANRKTFHYNNNFLNFTYFVNMRPSKVTRLSLVAGQKIKLSYNLYSTITSANPPNWTSNAIEIDFIRVGN